MLAAKEANLQHLVFGYTEQIRGEVEKGMMKNSPDFAGFCKSLIQELTLCSPKRSFGFGIHNSNFGGSFSNGKHSAVVRVANEQYAGKEFKHLNDILMMALTAEQPNFYDLTMEKSKAIQEVRNHKDVNLISFYKYKNRLDKSNWLNILIEEIASISNFKKQGAK